VVEGKGGVTLRLAGQQRPGNGGHERPQNGGHEQAVALACHTSACPWIGEAGEAARWGHSTVLGVAVQTGLNPIQISNEFKLF
jgi:hypothetical protein